MCWNDRSRGSHGHEANDRFRGKGDNNWWRGNIGKGIINNNKQGQQSTCGEGGFIMNVWYTRVENENKCYLQNTTNKIKNNIAAGLYRYRKSVWWKEIKTVWQRIDKADSTQIWSRDLNNHIVNNNQTCLPNESYKGRKKRDDTKQSEYLVLLPVCDGSKGQKYV